MSAKDLLAAIISGDKEAAASTFDSLMAEKTSEKIDELRITVAQKMFGEGKTPYEVGKDEKEAEDADEAADEADKKVTKDKGGDDSDSKEAETDAGEDDSEDDSDDDSDDKADDSNFKKKVSEEVDLEEGTAPGKPTWSAAVEKAKQKHASNINGTLSGKKMSHEDSVKNLSDQMQSVPKRHFGQLLKDAGLTK